MPTSPLAILPPLVWGAPTRVMGVVNVTPDSFSGDGRLDVEAAVRLGLEQVAAGASMLDVGGESSRPGALAVDEDAEMERVLPVVERLVARVQVPISVDTVKPRVAARALALGARILNDVSGLRDPDLARVAAEHDAGLVLMHTRWGQAVGQDTLGGYYPRAAAAPGTPLVDEVVARLDRLVEVALRAGVRDTHLLVDPGLGFGKTPRESLELLRCLEALRERLRPYPLLVGPSRKSFVGRALGLPVGDRLEGTLACVAVAAFAGAEVVRVHDVQPAVRAARMGWALRQGQAAELTPVPVAAPDPAAPQAHPAGGAAAP